MLNCMWDLQEVLVVLRSLNMVAEQQQSPFLRNDCCAEASLIFSAEKREVKIMI